MNNIVRLVLFLVAISWVVVNVAGLFMAMGDEPGMGHLVTHIALAVVFGIAAYLLRPWRPRPAAPADIDPRVELLQDDVSDLQRRLDEKQREQEFMEQLRAKRPDSPRE